MIDEHGEWMIMHPSVTQDTSVSFCLSPGLYEVLGSEGGNCQEGWGNGYLRATNIVGSELFDGFTVVSQPMGQPEGCVGTTILNVQKEAALTKYRPGDKVLVEGNRATGDSQGFCGMGCGGALYLEGSSTAEIHNTDFALNSAADGGAMFVDLLADLSLFGVTMRNNGASLNGGAMNVGTAATVSVSESTARDNVAGGSGGMLHVSDVAAATLQDVDAIGNIAGTEGGAVAVFESTRSTVTFKNSTIRRNKAQERNGGGVYVENSDVGVHGVHFLENSAELGDGGGVASGESLTNLEISDIKCVDLDVVLDWTATTEGVAAGTYGNTARCPIQYGNGPPQSCAEWITTDVTTCAELMSRDVTNSQGDAIDCTGCSCNDKCVLSDESIICVPIACVC